MYVKPVNISNCNAVYNRCCYKTYSSMPAFKGATVKRIPELDELLKESEMFYKEIYKRPNSIVNMPNMSSSSVIIEDSLPLATPHLLLFYNDKFSSSLAERYNSQIFHNDFRTIFSTLKKLYPEQNIIFFEHGSGNKNINGQNQKINAGKSVTAAHGHFCVLQKNSPSFFDEIMSKTKPILSDNNWSNLENIPVIKNESIPNTYAIYNIFNDTNCQEYPPYLTISEFDAKNNRSKSATFIQQNAGARTPSQCLRKVFSEVVLKEKNPLFWDWKRFFGEVLNGYRTDFIQKRIEQVHSGSVDFENRLKCII